MARVQYNINDLLKYIENAPNGIGEDLTYTNIYDDIKQARFEEDSNLSQGVWEHELKIPNWELVEQLSVDAIQNKSKDLQIVGWLVESLVILDKFEGISTSINILNEFIKKYWDNCYPVSDDNYKLRIIEWIYETVYRRSLLIPILGNNSFSLYDYEYALELNKNILKNPNNKNQILESANKNNIKFLEDINEIINNIDSNKIIKLNKNIENIKQNLDNFKNTIEEKLNNNRAFTKLINNIEIIEKLLSKRNINNNDNIVENINDNDSNDDTLKENINNYSNDNVKNESSNNTAECNSININKSLSREEIYKLLNSLYLLLKEVDKHSPSPYLLNLILEWKDKTLLEIINDVKTGNTESHQLLKMLLN